MPTFEWKGRNRSGQDQTGVLVADSKDAVIGMLRRQQVVVTAVKEKGKEIAVPKWGGKVPPQLIAIFTRQFSVMIDAGLPLVQCLEILGSQQEHKNFKRSLIQIRQDVESGSSLADAMRKHPKTFNQSLATLYFKKLITLQTALSRSSNPDELQEMISRGAGSLHQGTPSAATARPVRPA